MPDALSGRLRQHPKASEANFRGKHLDILLPRSGARQITGQSLPQDLVEGLCKHNRGVEAHFGDNEFVGHCGGPAEVHGTS